MSELNSSDSAPFRHPVPLGRDRGQRKGGGGAVIAKPPTLGTTQTLFAGLLKEKHRPLDVT